MHKETVWLGHLKLLEKVEYLTNNKGFDQPA